MNQPLPIISGLSKIAGQYDALVCDVWGVVHDGLKPYWPAVEALRRYRRERGRVVLLTNSPRLPSGIEVQFAQIGVPPDCWDAIVTSGGAVRGELGRRSAAGTLRVMHIGPERDEGLFAGLDISLVGPKDASVVVCSGLYDDETETPEHYRDLLAELKSLDLVMICANPDIMVQRGGKLVHCAGGVAASYEALGGKVTYYGKPHASIFELALETAGRPARPLVVGDGLETDVRGANAVGLDVLFVACGVHAKELGGLDSAHLAALFGRRGLAARAAIAALVW